MEETLVKILSALFGGRVFPDVAEIGTPVPFCVFRQIGGTPVNSLDGVPVGRKNALVEIVVVSRTRKETMELIRAVEDILVQSPVYANVMSGAQSLYDEETELRAATQEFSIWEPEPQNIANSI